MSLIRRVVGRSSSEARSSLALSQWLDFFSFNGLSYPFPVTSLGGDQQHEPGHDFLGYVNGLYKSNGIVFACMATRMLLFSEARMQFQQMVKGRPGDLYGTAELQPLETPWPGGTTGDLLSRAIQDVDLAGNWFARREGSSIIRMRPDWVTIVAGSVTGNADDARPLGYIFAPEGASAGEAPLLLGTEEVAHFAPYPDPEARFRGMSWLTPVVRDVMSDAAATTHKLKYWEQGASPNLVVQMGRMPNLDAFEMWKEKFHMENEGLANRFKTLFLANGADAKVVGSNLEQAAFVDVTAAGEVRIAAAAGTPPVIVGLSKGLDSATYSNYSQARRRLADGTMRPLWRNFAGSVDQLIRVPGGSRLWYDDRDIPFLREDQKDAADIQSVEAQTIHTLITAGYEPDSVIHAVSNNDFTLLAHSGLYSVQLQPAGMVSEGKGVVTGVPVAEGKTPAQIPAKAGSNGRAVEDQTGRLVRALLMKN